MSRASAAKTKGEEIVTANLFQNGRSQAVRLPKEFRFAGQKVRIRRVGAGVLLEQMEETATAAGIDAWFAKLDHYNEVAGAFMPPGSEGRCQEPTRSRKIFD